MVVPMRSRAWPAWALLVAGCAAGALGARAESVESFVARHWRVPLAAQGPPPARFTPLEASLAPEACGTCHPAQLADWRTTAGVTLTPAYLASEFCRGCHQFGPEGYALNGTLLENTYAEWKASRFAAAGVQCQDCHMPDRRHLWRGIHDADMVRGGLTITLVETPPHAAGTVAARLVVENSGVGHRFPTYVTPLVLLRAELVDAAGRALA